MFCKVLTTDKCYSTVVLACLESFVLLCCSIDPHRHKLVQICTNALPPVGARLPAHRGHVEGTCPCVTRHERQRRR